MNENKKQYQQVEFKVSLLTQNDVVRTSNGAELDYQQQGWSNGETGFDNPFGVN